MLRLYPARSAEEIEHARLLFLEYAGWIGVSLDFQKFDDEVATLPGDYAPPRGRLLLAEWDGGLAGCVALHPCDGADGGVVCEMKRLFVRDGQRGRGIGRGLAVWAIDEARAIGYRAMRLDTMSARMPSAVELYRSLGFVEIAPYRYNPMPDTLYFELALSTRDK
ncbi:MAG: GCN5-related N-acetyltransferase [bacterium]|nr:GCN5-related N-acetyltransferase [bacterium]